ncbi:hypothetical protein TRAPUB_3797 [Trametes pubescens]|uniref:Uncharacterized protein n=1 Tax=Trametes pubescens TaxID=154538 RepID=A0A1M2VCV0_TRAPU|nr:hypothetical protein TRAPUB_3797 [Trametes pubescens]
MCANPRRRPASITLIEFGRTTGTRRLAAWNRLRGGCESASADKWAGDVIGPNRKPATTWFRQSGATCHLAISMDLRSIVNPGDTGGIRTATSGTSSVTVMDASPGSQIRRSKQRSEKPSVSRRHPERTSPAKCKRAPDEQRMRGGAKPSMLQPPTPPARKGATSSRHWRHRQPPAPDRRLNTRTPPRQAKAPAMPTPSPAQDLLQRAQRSAATETDAAGRRPFVMDVILGGRPAVLQYSEDVILEAIELSRDALRPAAGPLDPEDEDDCSSATPRGDGRSANAGTAGMHDKTPRRVARPAFQVSAERSTAVWIQSDTSPREMSARSQLSSLSVGTPQHT